MSRNSIRSRERTLKGMRAHRVSRPTSPLRSAVADMLATGPKKMVDAIIYVEEYEGRPCIVLRDDAHMTGKPLGYRPIHEGETPSEARIAFVRTIAKDREINIVETEADNLPLEIEDIEGLEEE